MGGAELWKSEAPPWTRIPLISIVIATHNRAQFLGQAIRSALDQTVQGTEILVVDDGSTDSTPRVLRQFSDRISVIRQPNQGRSAARNTGVQQSCGDIIAFLDSDDIWLPEKLAKQLHEFERCASVGVVHTLSDVVDERGDLILDQTRRRMLLYHRALKRGYTYEGMSKECIMFLSTVAVRRQCWERTGPMDAGIPAFEDWDWYLRAAIQTEIATIRETLVHFRQHAGNTSSREFFEGRVMTCHKHLDLLDKRPDESRKGQAQRNFYLQLAGAYYVQGSVGQALEWMHRAMQIDPVVCFYPAHIRYFLAMCLPSWLFRGMRRISNHFTGEASNGLS